MFRRLLSGLYGNDKLHELSRRYLVFFFEICIFLFSFSLTFLFLKALTWLLSARRPLQTVSRAARAALLPPLQAHLAFSVQVVPLPRLLGPPTARAVCQALIHILEHQAAQAAVLELLKHRLAQRAAQAVVLVPIKQELVLSRAALVHRANTEC